MFQETYASMNGQIRPSPRLLAETSKLWGGKPTGKLGSIRRPAVLLAALLLCVALAIPALASGVPMIYDVLYFVSPATAQLFMPVRLSSESNGIRLEVLAVHIYENNAEIYVSLQDLTGQRVDETADLYDSYSINRPFDSVGYCERAEYDPETRTAFFRIHIREWGDHNIAGEKITFTARGFIAGKRSYEDLELDIDLARVGEAAGTTSAEIIGWGGGTGPGQPEGGEVVLIPSGDRLPVVEGIDISAIGYAQGDLHVQTAVEDPLHRDNHGYFYLVDADGKRIDHGYTIYSTETRWQGDEAFRTDYTDHVYAVPPQMLAGCRLYGSFYTSGSYTEGDWRVTIPLRELGGG